MYLSGIIGSGTIFCGLSNVGLSQVRQFVGSLSVGFSQSAERVGRLRVQLSRSSIDDERTLGGTSCLVGEAKIVTEGRKIRAQRRAFSLRLGQLQGLRQALCASCPCMCLPAFRLPHSDPALNMGARRISLGRLLQHRIGILTGEGMASARRR